MEGDRQAYGLAQQLDLALQIPSEHSVGVLYIPQRDPSREQVFSFHLPMSEPPNCGTPVKRQPRVDISSFMNLPTQPRNVRLSYFRQNDRSPDATEDGNYLKFIEDLGQRVWVRELMRANHFSGRFPSIITQDMQAVCAELATTSDRVVYHVGTLMHNKKNLTERVFSSLKVVIVFLQHRVAFAPLTVACLEPQSELERIYILVEPTKVNGHQFTIRVVSHKSVTLPPILPKLPAFLDFEKPSDRFQFRQFVANANRVVHMLPTFRARQLRRVIFLSTEMTKLEANEQQQQHERTSGKYKFGGRFSMKKSNTSPKPTPSNSTTTELKEPVVSSSSPTHEYLLSSDPKLEATPPTRPPRTSVTVVAQRSRSASVESPSRSSRESDATSIVYHQV